jgi:hypothetical protein
MGVVYDVEHTTTYTYKAPVTFARHRAMFLPRAGHGGRLDSYSITANVPTTVRWIRDALSNSVALIDFSQPTAELAVTFKFRVAHYGAEGIAECPVEPRGRNSPVQYAPGPGSIAVVIGMSSTAQAENCVILRHALIAIGIALTALFCYVVLKGASGLAKRLGPSGMSAMTGIMGFLLVCIGVQFIINGIAQLTGA